MVVEADIGPTLNTYKLIYLADTHVSQKASTALAAWVSAGGTLIATAGAGMFDELNKTNTVMSKLLGVTGVATYEPSEVQFIKQDLVNATTLGTASWRPVDGTMGDNATAVAAAARHFFTPAPTSTVIASYDDDKSSPAAIHTTSGKGTIFYFSFYLGLSYFLPAMPVRPADRGGTDDAYTHFIPTQFNKDVLALVKNISATAGVVQQVNCSNSLVHGKPVVSKTGKGVAVPLVNWAGNENLTNLTVTINVPAVKPGMKASLATGGKVTELHQSSGSATGGVSYQLDLGIADALILR